MVMQYLNFFKQVDSNGYTLKSLTWINILAIVQKDVFRCVNLEYPKELGELHNDYPLAPDEIDI